MKNKRFFGVFTFLMILNLAFGCSGNDHNDLSLPDKKGIELAGQWQLTNIDFTAFVDGGFPANDATMISGTTGYDFQEGGNFVFVADSGFGSADTEYWHWEGDAKGFEIIQNNPSMPPYNFGIKPENMELAEQTDGTIRMTFNAKLANGSEAEFTLIKVSTIDLDSLPEVTGVPEKEEATLVGQWQLTSIDFTTFVDGGFPANDAKMISGMIGYDFQDDGNFVFVTDADHGDPNAQYWHWEGDLSDFEVIQNNPAMPPYNFGFKPEELNIDAHSSGSQIMTFSAKLANGSVADFSLVKVEEVDLNHPPEVTGIN